VLGESYFGDGEPRVLQTTATYADAALRVEPHTEHGSVHTLGDVVNALIGVGLVIEFLHEFPFTGYRMLPRFERGDDGLWRPPPGVPAAPLLFSPRAHLPAG
jgi:hypothetical protein